MARLNKTVFFDWNELAFSSKKAVDQLRVVFIAAPRQLSTARLSEIIQTYLPQGNLLIGLAKDDFVDGFINQPQFKMLELSDIKLLIDKVNSLVEKHKIYILNYFQRDLPYILERLSFKKTVFVNGSWIYSFHTSKAFYTLISKKTPYELISPFTNETEAIAYEKSLNKLINRRLARLVPKQSSYSANELMNVAKLVASRSYDYTYQTGAVLAKASKSNPNRYIMLLSAYNKVVPYQTYAMHYGAARETYLSPPNDLNHYDTVHAETMLLIEALQAKQSIDNASLFINLMPCPICARLLSQTGLAEIVYSNDHSNGYGLNLLQLAGKQVRRLIV